MHKIHQVYISGGEIIPEFKPEWRGSWQEHFSWDYKLWRKSDIKLLLEKYPEYQKPYNEFGRTVEKADFIRNLILFDEGGIYADLDCFCTQNFEHILKGCEYFIQREKPNSKRNHLGIHLQYAKKGHKFSKAIMDRIVKYRNDDLGVINGTGPGMVRDAYEEFNEKETITIHNDFNFCRWIKCFDKHLFDHDVKRRQSKSTYAVHASVMTWIPH